MTLRLSEHFFFFKQDFTLTLFYLFGISSLTTEALFKMNNSFEIYTWKCHIF